MDDKTNEIMEKLGKLDGKMESILSSIDRQLDRQDSFNRRLLALEKRQSWFMGIIAVISGSLAIAAPWLLGFIN